MFDLNQISIWVYAPNLPGQHALIDFEVHTQMNDWEAGDTGELSSGDTAYNIQVQLVPYDLQPEHDFKYFDFYANPSSDPRPELDRCTAVGREFSLSPPSLLPASAAIQATTCGPFNTYGNITGKSPNTLMDFFVGTSTDSCVNLYWRGFKKDITAAGVMLYRLVGDEEPVLLTTDSFAAISQSSSFGRHNLIRRMRWLRELRHSNID